METIKNVVDAGLSQGWSKQNIITSIMFRIATEEELKLLEITDDIPELKQKAEILYDNLSAEYYEKNC